MRNVSEIVREKILTHYKQEIPTAASRGGASRALTSHASAPRSTSRAVQKHIVVGQGRMIKRVGMDSRKDIESSLARRSSWTCTFVDKNWRDDERKLKRSDTWTGPAMVLFSAKSTSGHVLNDRTDAALESIFLPLAWTTFWKWSSTRGGRRHEDHLHGAAIPGASETTWS